MFETRFFERPADDAELDHLHKRHTDVLDNIDATADEAKEVASDFRAQLKTLHEQEQNLRRNLKSGTIPVEVEAKAVANVEAGIMEYFDRDGNLIPQLTHELSKADREQDVLRKQLDMFQGSSEEHNISSVTIGTNTGQSVKLGDESASDEQTASSTDTDERPDSRDSINGAIAMLAGEDNPLPKGGKKKGKSDLTTV